MKRGVPSFLFKQVEGGVSLASTCFPHGETIASVESKLRIDLVWLADALGKGWEGNCQGNDVYKAAAAAFRSNRSLIKLDLPSPEPLFWSFFFFFPTVAQAKKRCIVCELSQHVLHQRD